MLLYCILAWTAHPIASCRPIDFYTLIVCSQRAVNYRELHLRWKLYRDMGVTLLGDLL